MWRWTSRHLSSRLPRGHLNMLIMASSWSLYDWASTGFWGPASGKSSSGDFNTCRLLWCHIILELAWESSHTRVATSKTSQIMMILAGTAAYIGSMTLIHEPHPGWFFTLANHHLVFTNADQFLGTVGGAKGADQRGITCRHLLLVLCTCKLQGET